MTLYAIHSGDNPAETTQALPQRLNWSAVLFTPIWLLANRAWAGFVLWLAGLVIVLALASFLGGGVGLWLYVLLALWFGFEAARLKAGVLNNLGRPEQALIVAPDADQALLRWLAQKDGRP